MSKYIDKYRNKKWYRICKVIMDSASFALILSVAFFAYEIFVGKKETKEVVDNLIEIQNSLSTKYLGLFPDFDFAYIRKSGLFDGLSNKDHAVKTIDDRYSSKRYYSATKQTYISYFELAISPAYFDHFYTKLT